MAARSSPNLKSLLPKKTFYYAICLSAQTL